MTTPSAKDLLAQADQLIRRQSSGEDLPVLTELVSEVSATKPIAMDASRDAIPSLTDFVEPSFGAPDQSVSATRAPSRREPTLAAAADNTDIFSSARPTFVASRAEVETTTSYTRAQFDAAVASKLDQMAHSVYSQVMQQLELHATGEMKRKLRIALEPALTQVALDIAAQVAEETSIQVQSIVASAVDNELARLREQIETKKRERENG